MAAKKTIRKARISARRPPATPKPRPVPRTGPRTTAASRTAKVLRERWSAAVSGLTAAEAAVEKQVRALMKKNGINAKDASAALADLQQRFGRERRKLMRQLGTRVKGVQGRLGKEGRVVGRRIDAAVRSALAALNIPSRQEVAELTAKVEALSRKIDSIRR
jgi:polyhydroxyalkanoate synthesis regulator phasin